MSSPAPKNSNTQPALDAKDRALLRELPQRVEVLRQRLSTRIIGQEQTIKELMVAFFAGGHVLVIGVPGLAKTLMISTLAELFNLDFSRIQFTPDLMPSDITGTSILVKNMETGDRGFEFRKGPIFSHLLLADEINRTPPKTQAALLEAMEEFQSTIGGTSYKMPSPFFVLATQNPIEQEGTYPLPVTQLDRFLYQINMSYPDAETEFDVVATTTAIDNTPLEPILNQQELLQLLKVVAKVQIPPAILQRATLLVRATRPHSQRLEEDSNSEQPLQPAQSIVVASKTAEELLAWGAGPRAVQAILSAARASAVLDGREVVSEKDYEEAICPSMRHRIILNYHAEAEGVLPDDVIQNIRIDIGDCPALEAAPAAKKPGRLARLLRIIGDPSPPLK